MLLQRQQLGQGVHALHRSERAAVLQQGQALGDVAEDLRLEVRRTLEVLQRGLNDGRLSRARTEGLRCERGEDQAGPTASWARTQETSRKTCRGVLGFRSEEKESGPAPGQDLRGYHGRLAGGREGRGVGSKIGKAPVW